MELSPIDAVVAMGLAVAVYTDLKSRRIPNSLNLFLIVAGLILHTPGLPWAEGIGFAALGLVVAFAVHFGLWALGVQRAGDAKLMMGLGALTGWAFMIEVTLWTLLLFVPVGFLALLIMGRLRQFKDAVVWTLFKAMRLPVGERPPATMIPYAPMIAAGWLAARFTDWLAFFG